jgi:hypothetical protein
MKAWKWSKKDSDDRSRHEHGRHSSHGTPAEEPDRICRLEN